MINKLKIFFYLFILTIFQSNFVYSQEKYCLDTEGLILPLFDDIECVNSSDIKINQNEFIHIITFKASERFKELEKFKENIEKSLKSKKKEIPDENTNKLSTEKSEEKKKEQLQIAKIQKIRWL